jgi:hypothetical protein
MSERTDNSSSTAKSVSPKVIIPAVTVVGVFVLILLAAVVFMLLRAYKRRKRHGPGLSRLDTESGSGVWREGDWDNHVRNGRLTRDSRQLQGRMPSDRDDVVRIPEPTVPRDSEPSWNARDIVGEGFRREEDPVAAKRTVNVRRGYEIDTAEERGHSVHAAEISLRVAPSVHSQTSSIGKIERMTGNKLSNDLYEDRPSGQGHPREGRDSVATTAPHQPRINTSIPPASMFDSYTVNADLSPASTIGSWAFGISSPVACTPLNPPPAPSPSQIAATYPNIAALARVNVTVSSKAAPKRQSSFLAREPSIAEHIASQFSHSRHKRLSNSSSATRGSSSTRKLAPPLSAARGGFTGLTRYDSKASQKSHTSSISTFRHGTLEEEEEPPPRPILLSAPPPPRSRAPSWSGRSVLVLDDEPRKPNSRTTLSPPASGTSTGNFLGFMEHGGGEGIQRSTSISKASVSSVPSSISSFSTVYAGVPGGLSPTPALRRPRIPRTTDDTSPVSETASSMTEAELEANKHRVRERVRRGSQERETGRKKEEEEDEFQPARTSFGFL